MSADKPQNDHGQKLAGHSYDGIDELDHPVPGWFKGLFYSTLLFGLGYFLHFTWGPGTAIEEEYARDLAADQLAQIALASASDAEPSEEDLAAAVKDAAVTERGHAQFASKCVSCHGAQGQGGIGPNLTDDYWIHGGKLTQILTTITKGVGDKGMPPWGVVLKKDELRAVAAYVRTLAGTKPPGAKAPQGEKVTRQ
jgi:cytochrome c oxidase cbb3-type subunit 3